MKKSRTESSRTFTFALILGLGLALGLPRAEGLAPTLSVVRFNITPVTGDTVFNDDLADSSEWQYADFRVSSLQPPVCVDAQVTTRSFTFIVLNRKLEDGVTRCSAQSGVPRNWAVVVGDGDACQRLSDYDPDRVELDLDQAGDPYSPCRLNGADNPRIRLANLYAPKLPATTPVAFLISSFNPPSGHGGYEIRSETEAPVQGTSTVRTAFYDGTARLWEFIGKAKPVANPFPLKLHMAFEKVTISQ